MGIKDLRLSRKQLKFQVVSGVTGLRVTHLGQNSSVVNGTPTSKGFSAVLKANDTVELLEGKFRYRLVEAQQARMMAGGGGKHWSQGLVASMSDPDSVLFEDDELCVIKDKYPKARIHLLVLPKDTMLVNLNSLNDSHIPLIRRMVAAGQDQVPPGTTPGVRMGFHAVPSMSRLHLHVISQDFDSPCLKHKKHWNSFNTDYFVPWEIIVDQLETNNKVLPADTSQTNQWLKRDLQCHKCQYKPKNLPDLKSHIRSHSK